MGGWMDGWMGGKAGLRIAYSNQKANFDTEPIPQFGKICLVEK
jgi:hypothetical protein